MSTPRQQQGGLSLQTLVIASAASVAAAIVVHKLWKGGAILGAAVTPVIVAIVSETLRKPVDRVTAIREQRRTPGGTLVQPPPEPVHEDRFGIWQEQRVPWWQRRTTRLAVATGLLAFVIGAFALTASELVFGGSVGGGNDRLTLPVGGKKDDTSKATTTETQPPEEQAPTETTPTVPPTEEEEVPTETTPPPTETAPTPPVTPSPTEPAPTPTEATPPPAEEPAPTP